MGRVFAKVKSLAHTAVGTIASCTCPSELVRAGACHCDFLDPGSDALGEPVTKTK